MLQNSIVRLKSSVFFTLFFFTVNIVFAQDGKRVLLNSNINLTDIDELNPQLTPDGKTLYFSRTNYVGNIGGKQGGQDIYTSTKDDNGVWQASKNIEKPLNNVENNALGGFSRNLSKAYVANVYGNNASQGISVANFDGKKFAKPTELLTDKEIASSGYLSFFVTPDEKYMLLSMFTDPIHNQDLFVSFQLPGGWTKPKTLGKIINTNGNELSPFLTKDGKTLFYASNGLGGFGDADIFYSNRLDESWTNWTAPKNLGNKVNTNGFDAYFITDTLFLQAYFCSGEDAKSSADIYQIAVADIDVLNKKLDTIKLVTNTNKKIYGTISKLLQKENYKFFNGAKTMHTNSILEVTEQADFLDYVPQQNYFGWDTIRTEVCITNDKRICDSILLVIEVQKQSMAVKNIVSDAISGKSISASFVLNNDTILRLKKVESNIPFEFICELKPFTKNKLVVCQSGYFPAVFSFDLRDSVNSFLYTNNVALKPIDVGSLIGLNNILFETGKSIIKEQSFDELDNLVSTLLKNPTMKINILGYTDNKGNEATNMKLSEERVKSVIQYLVNKSIDKSRLTGKGMGSKNPIDTNDTEDGRIKNRRVEFTIESK